MIIEYKFKEQRVKAQADIDSCLTVHSGVWKITIAYVSKKTGEVFKIGSVVFNPCLYYEIKNLCKDVIKGGGFITEVKAVLINKIINK